MAAPEPRPCPYCGSADTQAFPDGSGRCRNCARSFRGSTPVGGMIQGERMVTERRVARARDPVKVGVIGLLGGLLGWVAIPVVFVLGSVLHQQSLDAYVAAVFNVPSGAVVCAGLTLLALGGLYGMWAGFHVWRGYPERGIHLIIAGVLVVVASVLAGQGLAGVVGIVGGLLALLVGVLAWRVARAREAEESATATGS